MVSSIPETLWFTLHTFSVLNVLEFFEKKQFGYEYVNEHQDCFVFFPLLV
jgi:hypothetical protein